MRYAVVGLVAVFLLALVWWVPIDRDTSGRAVSADAAPYVALLDQYCSTCHDQDEKVAGLDFDGLDFDNMHKDAETWEKVVRKVKSGVMPPGGEPRPDREAMDDLALAVEERIDATAETVVAPANKSLHRLNRAEYANAIRDLLAMNVDVATLLPGDDASEGFDNIADALNVSPAHVEGYVNAAMKISRLAVGDRTLIPSRYTYRIPALLNQSKHIEGLPLGTRGGMMIEHNFPLDAEYEFRVGARGFFRLGSRRGGGGGPAYQAVMTIDGNPVKMGSPRGFRLPISAGPHKIGVSIVDLHRSNGVDDIFGQRSRSAGAGDIVIIGPYDPTGTGSTPSRDKIFVCYPEVAEQEQACAERIIHNLASIAFRRPLSADDESLATLMKFYQTGVEQGDFETGIQQALARILVDPRFLFRIEAEPDDVAPGEIYRIDDIELASRLSFFLWSSIPDRELLDVAAAGKLHEPEMLRQQVERMLADNKAQAMVDNFTGQWLLLRTLANVESDSPDFDDNLRAAFKTETKMLFADIVQNNRNVMDLLTADYTFVDERLAKHYGIPDVHGSYFRKVKWDADSPRRGLLGQGSILTVTSASNRTSPVQRGKWLLENVLGVPAPVPPAGVETDLDAVGGEAKATASVREKLALHRTDPVCASCHNIIDPLGLALENFDLVGKWREYDGTTPIDASGQLVDGTPLKGVNDLRDALLDRSDVFVSTVTEKLMTYALGRVVQYYDMPTVRKIVHDAEQHDYQFSSIIMGIVNSDAFQKRVKTDEDVTTSDHLALN